MALQLSLNAFLQVLCARELVRLTPCHLHLRNACALTTVDCDGEMWVEKAENLRQLLIKEHKCVGIISHGLRNSTNTCSWGEKIPHIGHKCETLQPYDNSLPLMPPQPTFASPNSPLLLLLLSTAAFFMLKFRYSNSHCCIIAAAAAVSSFSSSLFYFYFLGFVRVDVEFGGEFVGAVGVV